MLAKKAPNVRVVRPKVIGAYWTVGKPVPQAKKM
jgi:hypothetical protein